MPLPLDKSLKREVLLDGRPFTATISPRGVRLTAKGFRKGRELTWEALWALAHPEAGGGPEWTKGQEAESPAPGGHGTT
jgi:hypothetical protein